MSYHYLIMSELDFLKVQSIEEILRERANYYTVENNPQNYWIIVNPLFLKTKQVSTLFKKSIFYSQNGENSSYIAVLSTNEAFINWLQLRIGYFEILSTDNKINEKILDRKIKSDGITGKIEISTKDYNLYFKSMKNVSYDIAKLMNIS